MGESPQFGDGRAGLVLAPAVDLEPDLTADGIPWAAGKIQPSVMIHPYVTEHQYLPPPPWVKRFY
jgi:hypothetical protein